MRLIEDAAGVVGREVIPRVINVASPAAGADWSVPVPGGVLWHVLSIHAQLQASAVAANRVSHCVITDPDGIILLSVPAAAVITASASITNNWMLGFGGNTNASGAGTSLPDAFKYVLPSYLVGTQTIGMDVGDQWSAVRLYVLEISERPYDVELARDVAQLRGRTSNAIPEIREGL